MTERGRDLARELANARQDLANATARVAELEAATTPPTGAEPVKPSRILLLLRRFDLRISLGYGIIATLWILFSDRVLALLMSQDLMLSATFSLLKGLAFVWFTALVLSNLLHNELKRRNQIAAALEHDLIIRKQAEAQVTRLYRTLSVLSDINQAIVRIRDINVLFAEACKIAVEKGTFHMAWIGLFDPETRRIIPATSAGITDDYLEKLSISLDDPERGRGPAGTALRSGQRVIINNIQTNPMIAPWRTDAQRIGYKALACLPLTVMGETKGVIALYAAEQDLFDADEIRLLDEMAGDLSFAMEFAEKETRRQQAEIALQRYGKRLEILHEIDTGIITATSTESIVNTALEKIRQLIPCQRISIMVLDEKTNEWVIYAVNTSIDGLLESGTRIPNLSAAAEQYREGTLSVTDDLRQLSDPSPALQQLINEGLVSSIHAHFVVANRSLGSLNLFADTPAYFTAEYKEIVLQIANQIAIAIHQMQLADQIRENEAQYRLLAENMADVIWMLDVEKLRFTYVSPSVKHLRGYTPEEILNQTLPDALIPETADLIVQTLPQRMTAFLAGDPDAVTQTHVVEQPCKDGSTVWTEVVTTLLRDNNGALSILGVTRDITERRRAEAEILEREEWIRLSMEASGLGKWRYDVTSRLIRIDERAREHFGVDRDQITPDDLLSHVHPLDVATVRNQISTAANPLLLETQAMVEFRIVHADGEEHWLSILSAFYFEGQGESRHPIYSFGTTQDITARKRSEEQVRGLYRTLSVLSDINQAIVRTRDIQTLFVEACTIVVEKGIFRMAWIGMLDPQSRRVEPVAHAGLVDGYLEQLDIVVDDQLPESGPTASAVLSKQHVVVDDMRTAANMTPWRENALRLGYASSAAFPLMVAGEVRGTINIYSDQVAFFDADELRLLDELANDLSFAMEFAEKNHLREEAEKALQISEARQRAMLSAIPDIMVRTKRDGTFLDYHTRSLKDLAAPPEVFLGKKPGDIFPAELAQQMMEIISQASITQTPAQMEYQLELPFGKREYESRMVPVGDDEVIAIIRDVTERKQAERELQALYNATSYLFKADSLLGLGRQIVAAVVREFDRADCGIMLLDRTKNGILRLARTGQADIHPNEPLSLNGPGLVPLAMRTGNVIYVPDVSRDANYVASEATTQSEFVIPLRTANGIIGVLDMQHPQKEAFSERDRRILIAYAERAAPAIETMRLYEEVNRHAADLEWRVAQRTVELNSAKERAEAILNHSADGIILLDSDLQIEQTNFAFDAIFAAQVDAYFGQSFTGLLVDDDRQRISDVVQAGKADTTGQRIEVRAYRADGSIFDAELDIGHINKNGFVCVIRDITERKQAERAVAEERNLLRTLIDTLPDVIFVKDIHHKTLLSNIARAHSYGLQSPEETLGKDDYAFLPAEMAAVFHADEERLFETLQPLIDHEERTLGPSGEIIWASTTKVPLLNTEGELIGLVGVARDITERKQRERQLQFDAGIQASISDAVIVTDMQFRIQSWNKAAEIIYGWTADEVIGKASTAILQSDNLTDEVSEVMRHQLLVQKQWHSEFVQRRKDGSQLYVLSSITIFDDENGDPIGIVAVNRDITQRKQGEQALRESEERFRSLFESAPIATVISNQHGRITLVNHQAEILFGYVGQDLIGQPVEMLVPAAKQDAHSAMRDTYIANPSVRPMSTLAGLSAQRRDGSEVPVEIELSYIQTGDDLLVISFILDNTERKRAEQALRESEMRFGLLVNGVRDYAIYLLDTDGTILTWNQGAEVLNGYTFQEIIGSNIDRLHTPEDIADGVPQRILQVAIQEGNYIAEGERVRKDGTHYWASIAVTALKDSDGRLFGFAKVAHDLTERRNAQETLRLSEERYRLLAENITDVISRISPDAIYLDVSSSSKAVLGYSPDELIGKNIANFVHPEDEEITLQRRKESLKRRIAVPITYRFRHRDGHYIWLEVARKFIVDPQTDAIVEVVTSARDITVRKRAEEALKNALERERELGELKSRFVSMASHEFRTPLATILASVETLSAYRDKLSENQIRQKFSKITDQVIHLKSIMEDTLQLARLQDPKARYEPILIDFDAVCRSVVDEFVGRSDVTHKIVYTCLGSAYQVKLDRTLVRQMISNLLSNAVKYSASSSTITVTLEHVDELVRLQVSDQGIGIPEADLKHLFEPFHRATNVGTIPGTGLGLVIAKEAVELHGGFMTVESTVGLGTTFTIMLPFAGLKGERNDEDSAH